MSRDVGRSDPGESLLLLNFEHQPVSTPYRSAHAIYVRESARSTFDAIDVIPLPLRNRILSVRAFDAHAMMVDADIVDGSRAEHEITRQLSLPDVAYLHVHFARRGCYAARVDRA